MTDFENLLQHATRAADQAAQQGFWDSKNFDGLADNLMNVARLLADINATRIENSGGRGRPIPELSGDMQFQVKRIVEVGMNLAELMLDLVENQEGEYDCFVSFAGEQYRDYVSFLPERPRFSDWKVFVADNSMAPGQTPDPPREMLEQVLLSTVVVCVVSLDYVQKPWPVCELLCALARNRTAQSIGQTPAIVVDAMPGADWCSQRNPSEWVGDIKSLFPVRLPTMLAYKETTDNEHMEKVEINAVEAWKLATRSICGGVSLRRWLGTTVTILLAMIVLALVNSLIPPTPWSSSQQRTPSSTPEAPTKPPPSSQPTYEPSSQPSTQPTIHPSAAHPSSAPVGPCTIETGIKLRSEYDEHVYGCQRESCKIKIRNHWLDYLNNTVDIAGTVNVAVRGAMDRATGYEGADIGQGNITNVVKSNEEGAQITYRDHEWFVDLAVDENLEVTACFEGNRPCPWCGRNKDGRCTGYVAGSVTVFSPAVAYCPPERVAIETFGRRGL